MYSVMALMPLVRIYKANRHENERKIIQWESVYKLLTECVPRKYKMQSLLKMFFSVFTQNLLEMGQWKSRLWDKKEIKLGQKK